MESGAGHWAPPPALFQRFGVSRSDLGLSFLASITGIIIIATVPSRRDSFEVVGAVLRTAPGT